MIGIIALPLFVLRLMLTPVGLILTGLCLPVLLCLTIYDRLYGAIPDSEVPRYLTVAGIVGGAHVTAGSYHSVISIRITNAHAKRESPAGLWVACTAFGSASESGRPLGRYETLIAMRADPVFNPSNKPVDQVVPASSSQVLDFDTQTALPNHTLRTGETVGKCALGASKEQAMALMDYRAGTDQQGRMLSTTPLAKGLGMKEGW